MTEKNPIVKDRLEIWDDNRTNDLISITNTPYFRDRTMRCVLNSDKNALKEWHNFDRIIPFKATYLTLKPNVTVKLLVHNLSSQTASYEVDCDNDGIYENRYYGTDSICHFKQPGNHQIAMRGEIPNLQLYDGDNYYLKSIDQWGTIQWLSMHRAFSQCGEFNITAKDAPDLSHVTDMSEMFAWAKKMNANINHWDVSNVKDMKEMFYMAKSFNQPLDKWNTSNVVNMTSMFAHARKFNQNINSWNVSHVKNMSGMFYKAEKFNKPLDKWDVSHVEYMPDMFAYTFYNKPLRTWNLASLKDARGMFEHSSSDKYTDATPILFFKDKVFQDKVCQRIESIGRKCYLLYNEAADPWRDRDDYPDDPAYQKDDNDYERIF
jgi:surface protein